jgi:peptide/nickel transport system ATP-binding protein
MAETIPRVSRNAAEPLLRVEDLRVSFPLDVTTVEAVRGVSLSMLSGEIVGVVGGSGSGKSSLLSSIPQLLLPPGRISGGQIWLGSQNLTDLDEAQLRHVRGTQIGMVFQDPGGALNPAMRVGEHIAEVLRVHQGLSRGTAWRRAIELLASVDIHDPERRARSFPHQFSGGMQQRVLIAAALATEPSVLLADEPTTALDPTTELGILRLLRNLCVRRALGILVVTHDLRIAAAVCDWVAVMHEGLIVEEGTPNDLWSHSKHWYTRSLLEAVELQTGTADPQLETLSLGGEHASGGGPGSVTTADKLVTTSPGRNFVVVNDLKVSYRTPVTRGRHRRLKALDRVDIAVDQGEAVGVIGESGSGKSTLANALAGLIRPDSGTIVFNGIPLAALRGSQRKLWRRRTQIAFQGTSGDLNPTMTVRQTLLDVVRSGRAPLSQEQEDSTLEGALGDVGLGKEMLERFPHQLSGGQHQRVSLARALLPNPDLLILDEPTSSLDASIKGQIIKLLEGLRRSRGFAMLIVSHDLPIIRAITDRCYVVHEGRVVEVNSTEEVFSRPRHWYTESLIRASTFTELPSDEDMPSWQELKEDSER